MKCYKWIDQSVLQCHLTTLKSQRSNSYKAGIKKTTIDKKLTQLFQTPCPFLADPIICKRDLTLKTI